MTTWWTRRGILAAAGVLAPMSLLSSCTDGDRGNGEEGPEADSSTRGPHAEYSQVPDGGILRLAIDGIPTTWNPEHAHAATGDLDMLLAPLGHSPSIVTVSDGTITADQNYIESVEITSDDPQIITVVYNPDARWEDGTPIVAEDLIAQWKALRGDDPAFRIASRAGWEDISNIRALDEVTAEITFRRPYPSWTTLLHPSLPSSGSADAPTWNDTWTTTPTPSKGPFRISEIDAAAGTVTFDRHNTWWGRAPRLRTIIASVLDPEERRTAFGSGDLDLLEVSHVDDLDTSRSREGAVIVTGPGSRWAHVTMNVDGAGGALADLAVREAIARGIDREAIAREALEPLGAPLEVMDHLVYLPGQEGYEDSFDGLVHDPDAASALLDEAGWTLSEGSRSLDGTPLSMSVTVPDDSPTAARRAERVIADLSALGIDIHRKEVPGESFFPEHVRPRSFDLVSFSWSTTREPELSAINLFTPADSAQNPTGYEAPGVADVAERLRATSSPADRLPLGRELSTLQAAAFTIIPLHAVPQVRALAPGVLNIGQEHLGSLDWTAVGREG